MADDKRRKHQLSGIVAVSEPPECLLEEAHIKLSSWVSDLLGEARRMLQAVLKAAPARNYSSGRPAVTGHSAAMSDALERARSASRVSAASQDGA